MSKSFRRPVSSKAASGTRDWVEEDRGSCDDIFASDCSGRLGGSGGGTPWSSEADGNDDDVISGQRKSGHQFTEQVPCMLEKRRKITGVKLKSRTQAHLGQNRIIG